MQAKRVKTLQSDKKVKKAVVGSSNNVNQVMMPMGLTAAAVPIQFTKI